MDHVALLGGVLKHSGQTHVTVTVHAGAIVTATEANAQGTKTTTQMQQFGSNY
jgi:hypothetical protein